MAQDKSQIQSTYPLPVYNYRVTVLKAGESLVLSFAEISGLNIEYEPVTYKHGLSFLMGDKIIPGMRQPTRLTMKRGVVKNNDFLSGWLNHTYTDPAFTGAKRDILIDLCDEVGGPVIRWTVQSALPLKLDAPAFNANSNEVAIETLELIAHGLQVDYHPGS
jgi:phage tail-like protein